MKISPLLKSLLLIILIFITACSIIYFKSISICSIQQKIQSPLPQQKCIRITRHDNDGKTRFIPAHFGIATPIITVTSKQDEALYKELVRNQKWGIFWAIHGILVSGEATIDDFIIDWGVNFGFVSIMAARLGFQVAGVEAHPVTFRTLARNLRINCVSDKVKVVNIGVSDSSGVAYISNAPLSGANSIDPITQKRGTEWLSGFTKKDQVQIKKDIWTNIIETYEDFQKIDMRRCALLLKIDIEGSEISAIRGARKYLEMYPPSYIAFESNSNNYADKGIELFQLVSNMNYDLFFVGRVDGGLKESPMSTWLAWRDRPVGDIVAFLEAGFMGDIVAVRKQKSCMSNKFLWH